MGEDVTTLAIDALSNYDVALDGIGMMLATQDEADGLLRSSYGMVAPDLHIERTDIGAELTDNKLDSLYTSSNRSWHEGAGQKRLDVVQVSSDFKFFESKGIDIADKGEIKLHKATSLIVANAHSTTRPRLAVASDVLYMVAGQPNLTRVTTLTGTNTTVSTGTETSQNVADLASDGTDLYIALGADGIHKITAASGAGVHYSGVLATVLAWSKAALWAAGPSGGRDHLYSVAAGVVGNSSDVYAFPVNQSVVQITELGPMLYIAVTAATNSQSYVYAYDGTNAPFVALPLPPGEIITSMTPFLGAGLLIGAKRYIDATNSQSVLYVAFPGATGHLVLLERELLIRGSGTDSKDYGIVAGVGTGNKVFFAWPHDDVSGVGVYLPETAAYARNLFGATSGVIGAIARWRNKTLFVITGDGLYAEGDGYVPSATTCFVTSSVIDANVDADKLWLRQETGCEPLPAGTSVQHQYSTDGVTWVANGTLSTTGATILSSSVRVKSPRIQYRVVLIP
ncbi:MAG: hypothetical protein ABIW84_06745, partial [Ilumatobacteraceae bacterium]